MTEKTIKRRDLLLNEIGKSKMDIDDKLDLENLVQQAAETTNGSSDKIQGMSDVLFGIVTMMVSQRLDGGYGRLQGLFKVLIECKWAIVTAIGIISTLLVFHPELGELFKLLK